MTTIQWLFYRTPLGWLQLRHNPIRLLVCILGVAIADLLMFMQLGIVETNYGSATVLHRHLEFDLAIFSKRAKEIGNLTTFPRRRLYQAWDAQGVERVEPVYLGSLEWTQPETGKKISLLAVGIEPNSHVLQVEGLDELRSSLNFPDTFLLDSLGRGDFQALRIKFEHGQRLVSESGRRTLEVGGFFKLGASFARGGYAITSVENFLRIQQSRSAAQPSLGLVKLKAGASPSEAKASLQQRLPDDVRVVTAAEFSQMEIDFLNAETPMAFVFGTMLVVAFVVGATMVYQILSSDVDDHLAEYATFKAMGYTHNFLLWIVYEEAAILACLGFGPGVAGASLLYATIRAQAGIPIYMTPIRLGAIFVLTLLMCGTSGFLASRKLRQADPADIF
jgi:putative ABC transport system permease protein